MKDSAQAVRAILSGSPTRPVVAPLWDGIFASGVLGKTYASDVSAIELLDIADMCGFDPILRLGVDQLWSPVESLQPESRREERGGIRYHLTRVSCPAGSFEMVAEEPGITSATCLKDGTQSPAIYEIIEWHFNKILESGEVMRAQARKLKAEYADRAALFIGTLTPFELNFLAYPSIIMLYMDNQERHHELMELSLKVYRLVIDVVAEAGWDGLHTAGPPIELIGLNLYDALATSRLETIRQYTRDAGIWFTFHNCGHIRGLLEMGTYNRVKMDMFETLAPPPMGELDDLRWAREQLDPCICTRGNLDLEFLKTGTPKAIAARSREILRETEGYRHIVSTADEILAGTPVENVRAMVDGARSAS